MKNLLNKIVMVIVKIKEMAKAGEYTEEFKTLIAKKESLLNDLYELVVGEEVVVETLNSIDVNKEVNIAELAFTKILEAIEVKVTKLLPEPIIEAIDAPEVREVEETKEVEEENIAKTIESAGITIPYKTIWDTKVAKEKNPAEYFNKGMLLFVWKAESKLDDEQYNKLIKEAVKVNKMDKKEKELIDRLNKEIKEAREDFGTIGVQVQEIMGDEYALLIAKKQNKIKVVRRSKNPLDNSKIIQIVREKPVEALEEIKEAVAITSENKNPLAIDGYIFPDNKIKEDYLIIKEKYFKGNRISLSVAQKKMLNKFEQYKPNSPYTHFNTSKKS